MSDGDDIDTRLTSALERKPAVDVPAGFAARVAAQLPVQMAAVAPTTRYGLMAARIAMGVVLVALVVLATHSTGHTLVGVALQWVLYAELVGLAAWLTGVWKPMES